jgi:hypothetical protein
MEMVLNKKTKDLAWDTPSSALQTKAIVRKYTRINEFGRSVQ